MNSKFLLNVVIATITFFILGYVFYDLALGDYFMGHYSGGREEMIMWSLTVAQLGLGALAALAVKWKGAGDFMGGAKAAASVGALYAVAYAFDIYSWAQIDSVTPALLNWLLETARFFVVGGVLGWFAGRGKSE